MIKAIAYFTLAITLSTSSFANIYYVSISGSDVSGDGSITKPWKTLMYAVTQVVANQGHTIQVGAGTFVENGLVEVPLGVSIAGAGTDVTIFKAASSFYYHPATDPGYSPDKFLISLSEFNPLDGNQTLRDFTIDGDSKKLHGGIYVRYRNKVIIDEVKVENTNYCGIWLWDVQDSQVANSQLINCSWGSSGYCSGALNLGNLNHVEISQLQVDEDTGYGIKALGPDGYNDIFYLTIHDCHVSVSPFGLWNNGTAPNIAIELWQSTLVGCEIYNSYIDNTISLVNTAIPSTGNQTIRVHDNTLDMATRANGAGYGIELSVHDAEIDHNYFLKGNYGIANWTNSMQNWNIHHNTFYDLEEVTVGEVVRSQWSGLHNVKLYNNTIEFAGNKTMNVVGLYGGTSDNLDIKNNLVINSTTGYSFYPDQLIHSENGATITSGTLQILNNSTTDLDPGDLVYSILNLIIPNPLINLTVLPNPSVTMTGSRPTPYYIPATGSSLIDAGVNVGYAYAGSAPDIGAFESSPIAVANHSPLVSILDPASNASYPAGSSITLLANASDPDGTIAKVEFFQGTTKLGESTTSPYRFAWNNVSSGNYSLTAKATDNQGATTTSATIAITVSNVNQAPIVSITTPANNATFTTGSTVTIAANATDSDGTIAKVEFFQGATKLGESTVSPYGFVWNNVPMGNYSLTAKATDNQGAITSSTAISIVVSNSNVPPLISIMSPTNNESFTAGSTVTIIASATDSDGTITKVEFFQGATKLGETTASPYSFAWNNVPAGNYFLTARATDNQDGVTISPVVPISVKADSLTASTHQIVLYPNPASAEFIIEYVSNSLQQVDIRIYDVMAKLIRRLQASVIVGLNKIRVDVDDLSNNMYVISVSPENDDSHTFKVIVIH